MGTEIKKALAYKVICGHPDLSGSDKQVAMALVDRFNRETGRCDPSIQRLCEDTGLIVRTVTRATRKLHELGLILKVSHGGHASCASYEPRWAVLAAMNADWEERTSRSNRTKMSSGTGQECPQTQDKNVQQTQTTKPDKKPSEVRAGGTKDAGDPRKRPRPPRQRTLMLPINGGRSTSRELAATTAANKAVENFLRAVNGRYDIYALSVSSEQHEQVVSAERQKKGEGAAMALRLLEDLQDQARTARAG